MQHANAAAVPNMGITILYEDADVVVINKPTGLLVHDDGVSDAPTVSGWFMEHAPDAEGVGEPITRSDGTLIRKPGIVHRLDQETSGVLILAKNQEAFLFLKEQFKERLAQKEYRAFVYGQVRERKGTVDRPIGRSSKDFRLRSAQRGAKGLLRPAVTDWVRIAEAREHSYLAVFPKTGRTHQIRTHLKAINHPIVCDTLYAPKREAALGFSRLALHAYRLTLTLPSGKEHTFVAPLPQDFLDAEAALSAEAA